MKKITILLLPLITLHLRINILTTIIVNEAPFIQNLNCADCLPPVTYSAIGLPSFAILQNNQLQINSHP